MRSDPLAPATAGTAFTAGVIHSLIALRRFASSPVA
jgi:hypothetical protein